MILADWEILELIDKGMIAPAERELVGRAEGCISHGLSSYGYDVRLGNEFVRYRNRTTPLDPCRVTEEDVDRFEAEEWRIQPNEFLLATTLETLRMPPDVTGLLHDKSTLARSGLSIQNTVIEAGFQGQVTVEIHNQQPFSVILRAGQGIGQILFLRGEPCHVTYADRKGKYQGQEGVVLPKA